MFHAGVHSWIGNIFTENSDVPVPESILEWGPKNITLTKEESKQFPGPFNPELSPAVTILFEFYESDDWDEFVCSKSSQLGMTLALLVLICHKIKFNPQDIILALNNREEIQRVGNTRLKPMITGCKAIAQRVPADEDKLQNMTLYLIGLTLYLIGSQAAGAAANKSCGLAAVDETDESPDSLGNNESNILDLLRDRLKRQDSAKLIAFSKPRNDDDVIWPEFLTGSRHKCFVPCPHCAEDQLMQRWAGPSRLYPARPSDLPVCYQELVWEQVRFGHCRDAKRNIWDYQKVLKETYYECKTCAGKIEERHKAWMLKHRVYLPTNFGEDPEHLPVPRKMSYQCSDIYALPHIPKSTLGHLALEWVSCTTSSQRKKFRRSRLGLPEGEITTAKKRKLADILNLQGHYERGHCSRRPAIVIMAVDVQHDTKKWAVVAFFDDDTAEIVQHGATLTFADLLIIFTTPIIVDDWGDTPEEERLNPAPEVALIDEGDGHYTKTVLDFCTSRGAYGKFWPAKGRGGIQTLSMKDIVDFQKNHVHNGKRLPRYIFNDEAFKEELYDERIGLAREIRKAKREGLVPPAAELRMYRAPDSEFCSEFLNERRWTTEDDERSKTKRKKAGSRRGKLLKPGDWFKEGPNDWPDAVKMCHVGWYRVRRLFVDEIYDEDDDDAEQRSEIAEEKTIEPATE